MKALLRPSLLIVAVIAAVLIFAMATCKARYAISFMYDSNPPQNMVPPWQTPAR